MRKFGLSHIAPQRRRAWVLTLIFTALAAITATAAYAEFAGAAVDPADISIQYVSPATFSPNGDGQEDTSTIGFCLDSPANVTATVQNSANSTVRTFASGVSYPAGCFSSMSWDGHDDSGNPAPDAEYTVALSASNSSGTSTSATASIVVDRRLPGSLTAPVPGATLSGTVDVAFAPTTGVNVTHVNVSFSNCNGQHAATTAGDGVFRAAIDTSTCDGPSAVTAYVAWTDANGQPHGYQTPAVNVTLDNPNPPHLELYQYAGTSFSPNGDEQEDKHSFYYCTTDRSDQGQIHVTVKIKNGNGDTVRTLTDENREPDPYCSNWYYSHPTTWDGLTDDSSPAPDGNYTVEITATDNTNLTSTHTGTVTVDRSVPGTITTPTAGDTLAGTANFAFTPTTGVTVNQVAFYLTDCITDWPNATADAAGVYRSTIDTSKCPGSTTVYAWVSWTDSTGQTHGYQSPPVSVTLNNPPHIELYQYWGTWFSPNGDGQEDSTYFTYCTSAQGQIHVTVKIKNGNGDTVRTLTDENREPDPYCSNWYYSHPTTWDGLTDDSSPAPDGNYTVEITATDNTNLTSTHTGTVTVDRSVPGTITTPTAGDTLAGTANFAFTPTTGVEIRQVSISFAGVSTNIYNASADGIWRTTFPVGSLPQGPSTVDWSVSWVDGVGGSHWYTGPPLQVAIDPTGIPLTIDENVVSGAVPLDARLTVHASDPNSQPLQVYVDWGDESDPQTSTVPSPYDPVPLTHTYEIPGSFNAFVSISNGQGGYAAQTIPIVVNGQPNTPPVVDVVSTPTSGTVPLVLQTTIAATDTDDEPLTYRINYGDGTSVQQGSVGTEPVEHTYSQPGSYTLRAEVSDGKATVVRYQHITTTLSEPLKASAGDDQVATVGDAVRFDASGSRPDAAITRYIWDFGDGTTGEGVGPAHSYAAPGTYTAKLTAFIGTQSDVDTAQIEVEPVPVAPGLQVTVTGGGAALPGATALLVASDGTRTSGLTGNDGTTRLQNLTDGSYTIYAVKSGYLPAKAAATIVDGRGTVTVDLKAGDVATASVTSTPMTREEIVEAGIDVDDPANQNVVEFQVQLAFSTDTTFQGYSNSNGFATCPTFAEVVVSCSGGDSGWDVARFETSGYEVYVSNQVSTQGQRQLVWMVIPGKSKWLKEFFDVQLMVTNLAVGDDFVIDQGSARLTLPEGLSLAPTSSPQSATVDFPAVPAGQSRTVDWFLRGDAEGEYPVSASYTGVLQPFGETISLDAQPTRPIHVWGGSAFKLSVDADDRADAGNPYHVTVGITNVADVPMYNVSLELLKDGRKDYIYQPREQLAHFDDAIGPGETFSHEYILVPKTSGDLDLTKSFVSYSVRSRVRQLHDHLAPAGRATGHGAEVARLQVRRRRGAQVGRRRRRVGRADLRHPGRRHRTSQPPRCRPSSWDRTPPSSTTSPTTRRVSMLVSPIIGGRPYLRHPLAVPGSGATTYPLINSGTLGCTENGVQLQAVDPVFPLSEYAVVSRNAGNSEGEQVTTGQVGPNGSFFVAVDRSAIPARVYEVTVTNSVGKSASITIGGARCGDTNKDGHLRVAVMGDSFISGEGAFSYMTGTDVHGDGKNLCHRAKTSWGIKIAERLLSSESDLFTNLSQRVTDQRRDQLLFSACSGAETRNILTEGQYREAAQLKQLENFGQETVDQIFISIGGNDLGFGSIIDTCLRSDCATDPNWQKRVYADINQAMLNVEKTLDTIRLASPEAEVYLMAYPDPPNPPPTSQCGGLEFKVPIMVAGRIQEVKVLSMSPAEQKWVHEDLVPRIDGGLSLVSQLSRVHLVDSEDAFENHGICSSNPYFNGLELGNDIEATVPVVNVKVPLPLGNESFHPNQSGHSKLVALFASKFVENSLIGSNPNGEPVAPPTSPYLAASVVGDRVIALSNAGEFSVQYADPNTAVVLANYSVPTVLAEGTTDSSGNLVLPFTVPANASPGMHHLVLYNKATGQPIATTHFVVPPGEIGCADLEHDVDGDGVEDSCDLDNSDGPAADADDDNVANGTDNCLTVSNTAQTESDDDGIGDACDPDSGNNPLDTFRTPPVITSGPASTSGSIGSPYEFQFTATGNPQPTWATADDLPPGTTLSADGRLSGTPTEGGRYAFTVNAVNAVGSASVDLILEIEQAPAITGSPSTTAVVGAAYSDRFTATGFPVPAFSVSAGSLPDGLTLAPDGALSGMPTAAGDFTFRVKAGNPVGEAQSEPVTVSVRSIPTITSGPPTPSVLVGETYAFDLIATGTPAPTFTVVTGSLPDGLTLSSDGKISGTPTTTGTSTFVVGASNDSGGTTAGPYTIAVYRKPAVISDPPPQMAILNQPFSFTFSATGDPAPTFAVSDGSLPTGLSLSSDGLLSGTPTATGTFVFSIDATNASGTVTEGPFTLTVVDPPAITSGTPPATAVVGDAFSFTFTASGIPGPNFSKASGSLPIGLVLDADGNLHGTPTAAGSFTFSVKAANAGGDATGGPYMVSVLERPAISPANPPDGTVDTAYDYTFVASGSPTPVVSLADGNLPTGLSITASGKLSGTPTATGTFSFVIKASNDAGEVTAGPFTVTVLERNHAPIAHPQSVSVPQDGSVAITLTGSSADGDALTYAVVSDPAHGTLSGDAPNLTYAPTAGYSGPDSFVFTVGEGQFDSTEATVSIDVVKGNAAPTANNGSVATVEGKAVAITLSGSDPDGDELTYAVVTNPAHGTLSGTAPKLTYTPAAGYAGTDSFTFKANDGVLESNIATISMTVTRSTSCTKVSPVMDIQISKDQRRATSQQLSTGRFSTRSAGELLVLFVQADGPARKLQSVSKVSGGGLTWTRASRANQGGGTAEVWQAYASAKLKRAVVTATLAKAGYGGSVTLTSFTGSGKQVGAVANGSGTTGRPKLSLTPVSCNSFVWASGHNPENARTPSAGTGQAIVHNFVNRKGGDTAWVQRVVKPTISRSSVTISATSPARDRWQLAAIEIKPG